MKILVFSDLPPYVLGGKENQVSRLTDAWTESGHHVEIAGSRIPSKTIVQGGKTTILHHLRVFYDLGRFGRAFTYFTSTIILLLRLRGKFDIIYCRGFGDALISVCIAKSLRMISTPTIACPINAKRQGDANFIRTIPGWKLLVKIINIHCNSLNIIAKDILPDIENLGVKIDQISHIPNGVPIYPHNRKRKHGKKRRLIFTGRFCRQKGIDVLMKSLSQIQKEGYDFHCDLVGDGPLKNDLRKSIMDHTLSDYVQIRKPMPADQIRSLLLDYDVFVLPSRYEGMSNSVLEAMETGMPVILTRCGGIDHYIDDKSGWKCDPENPDALSEQLRSMLKTRPAKLHEMGLNARKLVEEYFNIDDIAFQNIEWFKKIIRK